MRNLVEYDNETTPESQESIQQIINTNPAAAPLSAAGISVPSLATAKQISQALIGGNVHEGGVPPWLLPDNPTEAAAEPKLQDAPKHKPRSGRGHAPPQKMRKLSSGLPVFSAVVYFSLSSTKPGYQILVVCGMLVHVAALVKSFRNKWLKKAFDMLLLLFVILL